MDYYDPATVATLRGVFRFVIPEAVLLAVACVLFLAGTARRGSRHVAGAVALVGFALAAIAALVQPRPTADLVPTVSAVWPDALAAFTRTVALVGGAVLVLLSWD